MPADAPPGRGTAGAVPAPSLLSRLPAWRGAVDGGQVGDGLREQQDLIKARFLTVDEHVSGLDLAACRVRGHLEGQLDRGEVLGWLFPALLARRVGDGEEDLVYTATLVRPQTRRVVLGANLALVGAGDLNQGRTDPDRDVVGRVIGVMGGER